MPRKRPRLADSKGSIKQSPGSSQEDMEVNFQSADEAGSSTNARFRTTSAFSDANIEASALSYDVQDVEVIVEEDTTQITEHNDFQHPGLSRYFQQIEGDGSPKLKLVCVFPDSDKPDAKKCGKEFNVKKGYYWGLKKHLKGVHSVQVMSAQNKGIRTTKPIIQLGKKKYITSQAKKKKFVKGVIDMLAQSQVDLEGNFQNIDDPSNEVGGLNYDVEDVEVIIDEESAHLNERNEFRHPGLSKYFQQIEGDGSAKIRLLCLFPESDKPGAKKCGKEFNVKKGYYWNLKKHLRGVHSVELIGPRKQGPRPKPLSAQCSKKRYAASHPQQKRFDRGVIDMLAVDCAPFNFVNGLAFQNLILDLDPRIVVKRRSTYTAQLQKVIDNEIKPKINAALAGIERRYCNFACDIWSTRRSEGFLGIYCYYINETWQLVSSTIAFRRLAERHNGDYIKETFHSIIEEFGFPESWGGVVVTDNASNMKKAFDMDGVLQCKDEFESSFEEDGFDSTDDTDGEKSDETYSNDVINMIEESDDIKDDYDNFGVPKQPLVSGHLTCISHSLQLVINDSIAEDQETKAFLKYIYSVMVFFKRSTRLSEELKKVAKLGAVIPGITRWNRMLDMIARFQNDKFFHAVRQLLVAARLDPNRVGIPSPEPLTDVDYVKFKEINDILRPLGDATDKLQFEGITSNLVILAIVSAFRRLQALRCEHFDTLRSTMLQKLKERMEGIVKKEEYVLATILDPRQKLKPFLLPWDSEDLFELPTKAQAMEEIRLAYEFESIFVANMNQNLDFQPTEQTSSMSLKEAEHSVFDILHEAPQETQAKKHEIEQYIEEEMKDESTSPLEYWNLKSSKFPILGRLARKYFAIPATSGGIKRTFSVAGAIARAKRANVSVTNLEKLIFLRQDRIDGIRKRLEAYGRRKICNNRENNVGNVE